MKLYAIWYRDFQTRYEVLDSIWTDPDSAKIRLQDISFNFDKYNDYDHFSHPWSTEVETDAVLKLDLRESSKIE